MGIVLHHWLLSTRFTLSIGSKLQRKIDCQTPFYSQISAWSDWLLQELSKFWRITSAQKNETWALNSLHEQYDRCSQSDINIEYYPFGRDHTVVYCNRTRAHNAGFIAQFTVPIPHSFMFNVVCFSLSIPILTFLTNRINEYSRIHFKYTFADEMLKFSC